MVATTSTQHIYIVENSTVLVTHAANSSGQGGDSDGVNGGGGGVSGGGGVGTGDHESGMNSGAGTGAASSGQLGGGLTGGAVYYKHSHVATSAVSKCCSCMHSMSAACYVLCAVFALMSLLVLPQ